MAGCLKTSRAMPLAGRRRVVDRALELEPAARDQVVADVMRAVGVGPLAPRALRRGNGALGDLELVGARTPRQLLDRLPVAIARRAIHVDVRAGRIAPEDPLDAADAPRRTSASRAPTAPASC